MTKYIIALFIALLSYINANAQQDSIIRPDSLVDIKPSFKGGEKAYIKFLTKTVRYPAYDRERNIMGKVEVSVIVETDGTLTNFEIKSTPSKTLGEEALRVLKLSPPWVPGTVKNVPVRVRHIIPLSFTLG